MSSWLAAFALLASSAVASPALAQETASETAVARRLFIEGIRAARNGDYETAHEKFQRSWEVSPRQSTLLNLAGAQVQVGNLVEAYESYRRYLRDGPDERRRQLAESALADLDTRTPRLTFRIEGVREGDQLLLDGDEVATAMVGESIPVNPGIHHIEVRRGGVRATDVEVEVSEAEVRVVTLDASHAPSPVELEPGEGSSVDDPLANPLLWAGLVAGLVVIVVAAVLVFGGEEPGPSTFVGNVPPGTITLR